MSPESFLRARFHELISAIYENHQVPEQEIKDCIKDRNLILQFRLVPLNGKRTKLTKLAIAALLALVELDGPQKLAAIAKACDDHEANSYMVRTMRDLVERELVNQPTRGTYALTDDGKAAAERFAERQN